MGKSSTGKSSLTNALFGFCGLENRKESFYINMAAAWIRNEKNRFGDFYDSIMAKVDLLGNGEGFKWDELVNLPSDGQKILIDEKCAETMEQLSKSLGIKMETIACYSAKKRYRLYDLLHVMIMQSGIKGWKISINPKDWTEYCDLRVRELLQKAKEN